MSAAADGGRALPAPRIGVATLVAAAVVVALSLADGGVGPDAAANLRMAQHLALGGGLEHPAATASGTAWFATWPPGYPALVAVPIRAGLDGWWASKLVGALSLVVCARLLVALVPGPRHLALAPLGLASVLHLFAWSASEGPFAAALLGLAAALATHGATGGWRPAAGAATAALAAFLLRYVGLVAVPLLGLAALRELAAGRRRHALQLGVASLPSLGAAAWLLSTNAAVTGHATGVPRLPAPEPWAAWTVALGRGLVAELLPTVRVLSSEPMALAAALVGAAVLGLGAWSVLGTEDRGRLVWTPASGALAATGGAYLLALVGLRAVRHFDLFTWRLLAPATLLLAAAGLAAAAGLGELARRRLGTAAATASLAGVVSSVLLSGAEPGDALATHAAVRARYAGLPAGCVVGPHDPQLPWLRPDLLPAMPRFPPYDADAETVDAFRARLLTTPAPCVRLEVRHDLDPRRFHPSWAGLAADAPAGTLQVLR